VDLVNWLLSSVVEVLEDDENVLNGLEVVTGAEKVLFKSNVVFLRSVLIGLTVGRDDEIPTSRDVGIFREDVVSGRSNDDRVVLGSSVDVESVMFCCLFDGVVWIGVVVDIFFSLLLNVFLIFIATFLSVIVSGVTFLTSASSMSFCSMSSAKLPRRPGVGTFFPPEKNKFLLEK
jgi:hypothetical protein